MAYRKISADRIFTGNTTVEGFVLITTGTGTVIDFVKKEDAGDDVETLEGLLCPGFVNAHCHTELSHMQGLVSEHTGMVPFLMKVMFERQADDQIKQTAIRQSIALMEANGIVAVGDICNTADSARIKAAASQVFFHNFIETSGFTPTSAAMRFEQAVAVSQQFGTYFPASQTSITPHAPYSVSEKLFELVASQGSPIISVHNQESQAEDDFIRHKSGDLLQLYKAIGANIDFFEARQTSSLQYMLPLFAPNTQVILVHNCHTKPGDIDELKASQARSGNQYYFCVCPNANLYIGNPLPNLQLLQKSKIPICIGTDSLASNHQLSVLAELQTLQQHFPDLILNNLLQWATLNGAKALKADTLLGSFEKGKKPGVLQLKNIVGDSLGKAAVSKIL
jgi:cytosine/adenosine deaminase-related metal-dependent hydrolase